MGLTNTTVVAEKKFSNHPNRLQTEMVALIVFFTFFARKMQQRVLQRGPSQMLLLYNEWEAPFTASVCPAGQSVHVQVDFAPSLQRYV